MVNELCRIMKNCSVYLPWSEVAEKVSYFVKRMAYCGYDDKFRYAVVKIAVNRHKKRIEGWKNGEGMFEERRTDSERTEAIRKKRDWYKSDGKYDSVMIVQPTNGRFTIEEVTGNSEKEQSQVEGDREGWADDEESTSKE